MILMLNAMISVIIKLRYFHDSLVFFEILAAGCESFFPKRVQFPKTFTE